MKLGNLKGFLSSSYFFNCSRTRGEGGGGGEHYFTSNVDICFLKSKKMLISKICLVALFQFKSNAKKKSARCSTIHIILVIGKILAVGIYSNFMQMNNCQDQQNHGTS